MMARPFMQGQEWNAATCLQWLDLDLSNGTGRTSDLFWLMPLPTVWGLMAHSRLAFF